jgi:hypothetical protein
MKMKSRKFDKIDKKKMFLSFLFFEVKSVEISELISKVQSIRSDIQLITEAVAEERTQEDNSEYYTGLLPSGTPMVCLINEDGPHHCAPITGPIRKNPFLRNAAISFVWSGNQSTCPESVPRGHIHGKHRSNIAAHLPMRVIRNSAGPYYRAFLTTPQLPPPEWPHSNVAARLPTRIIRNSAPSKGFHYGTMTHPSKPGVFYSPDFSTSRLPITILPYAERSRYSGGIPTAQTGSPGPRPPPPPFGWKSFRNYESIYPEEPIYSEDKFNSRHKYGHGQGFGSSPGEHYCFGPLCF